MKPDNFLVEFLTETIPHYASDPTWRNTFHELANLSEEERTGMLQQLNTVPVSLLGLEDEDQFPTIKAFLRLNLEDPAMPKMMIKLIDHENIRVQKISEQEGIA
ncbi:hypothetical protein [Desulfosporosinus sp.]|uniref:hypothetical protein n=1 Tax=Desulfosporosinus sp. TaxID=157907 RepID=UPI0026176A94|nr:hypothetical protein [Desulfosporosinus sp.]